MFLMTSEVERMPTRLFASSTTHRRCFRCRVSTSAASLMLSSMWIVKASSVVSSPTVVATIFRALTAISCCVSGSSMSKGRIAPVSSFWMKSNAVTHPTRLLVIGSTTGAPLNPAASSETIASSTVSVVFSVLGFGVMQSRTRRVFAFVGVPTKTLEWVEKAAPLAIDSAVIGSARYLMVDPFGCLFSIQLFPPLSVSITVALVL
mmetsp:Transcript_10991/g.26409  ORF Transcript_10991/g.26409 Transcript_10991/m.26409 type:complete len:205 (-) Transcript_10991:40-654(-)